MKMMSNEHHVDHGVTLMFAIIFVFARLVCGRVCAPQPEGRAARRRWVWCRSVARQFVPIVPSP
jgi:hypothetical protein